MAEAVQTGSVVVKPGREYQVDLAGYMLPKEAKLVAIHVLGSPMSHYYYQKIIPGKSVYLMNAKNLKSSTGSPPFSGLKNGDDAFLIIGSETQPGSINMGILLCNESISILIRK